jgi:hypothetical protein
VGEGSAFLPGSPVKAVPPEGETRRRLGGSLGFHHQKLVGEKGAKIRQDRVDGRRQSR